MSEKKLVTEDGKYTFEYEVLKGKVDGKVYIKISVPFYGLGETEEDSVNSLKTCLKDLFEWQRIREEAKS